MRSCEETMKIISNFIKRMLILMKKLQK